MVEVGLTILLAVTALAAIDQLRAHNQRRRDAARICYDVIFPHDFKHEAVLGFVQALSGALAPAGPDFFGVQTIVFEAIASRAGRRYRIAVPPHLEHEMQHQLETHIPGVQVTVAPPSEDRWMVATELRKTNNNLAMTILSHEAATRTLLAGLDIRSRDGVVMLQLVFAPSMWRTPLGEEKDRMPKGRLAVSGRLAARSTTPSAARHLLFQLWHAINALRTHAVGLNRRHIPESWVLDRVRRRAARRWFFPAHLSVTELSVLSAFPADVSGDIQGLPTQRARHLYPDPAIASRGVPFAVSNAPGLSPRPLAVTPDGRMQHTMIVGPTGSGKSSAMAGMAVGDLTRGAGVGVLGPADLIEDVLSRVPANRAGDVIVFEPARGDTAIGLDIFAGAHPATAADHVLSIFAELHKGSWGPRMAFHLRNALQTLAARPGATLCDIQRLLADGLYRRDCLRYVTNPQLQLDWQAYEAMTPRVRSGEISPVINKIQPLLAHDRLRAVFGQRSAALDVNAVLREGKILLIALPKGELGEEASRLIGSVFVSLFWRAILARSASPVRPDYYFYIDECASYLNLPVSLDEMLAQGRAYRAGFTLAFQSTSQFSPTQRAGILANARNKMVFRSAHEDARLLGKELGLEHPEELQRLRRFEVMLQLMTEEGPSRATTGSTLPLGPATSLAEQIRAASAARYGRPRQDIIHELDRDLRGLEAPVPRLVEGELVLPSSLGLQPVGVEP